MDSLVPMLCSHRDRVGGLWVEIGRLQLAFLVRHGLKPNHMLLDVGCGCFRGGVHFLRYLEPGHYYGLDADASLIKAGFASELEPLGLLPRLPPDNVIVEAAFDASRFGVTFDFALAQSVFTHISANDIRLCLVRLARSVRPGGVFFATFFECPPGHAEDTPLTHEPGGITTYMNLDPFHYREEFVRGLCTGLPWRMENIGSWGHPRGQKMLRFERDAAK
jgi:SAM-dependent methyltransferase